MGIIESRKISDVFKYVSDGTLVAFDVDNTLITPISGMGGAIWFKHNVDRLIGRGVDPIIANDRVYAAFVDIQSFISVRPVETQTVEVVSKLHKLGIKTVGLTARGVSLKDRTVEQLRSVGISLCANTVYDKLVVLDEKAVFDSGVISVNHGKFPGKGRRLLAFLEKIKYNPKKIVFVDDDVSFIEDVSLVLKENKVPFTCIRYGVMDELNFTFDPARADDELRAISSIANRPAIREII